MSVCGKLGNTRRHCKSRTATWLTMLRLYICTRSFRQWAQQLKVIKCSISTSGRFINEFWMGSVHSTEVHPGNGTFPSGLTFALLSVGARKSSWPVSPSAPHGIQSRDPRGPEEVCPTSPGCAPAPHLPGAGRPRGGRAERLQPLVGRTPASSGDSPPSTTIFLFSGDAVVNSALSVQLLP